MEVISQNRSFDGTVGFYRHEAVSTACAMKFAVYMPPHAGTGRRVPVLYYLAGLTCTEETFMIKAGAQRIAAELGIALVAADTSPRGVKLPGDNDSWDFGVGAGFYVDATLTRDEEIVFDAGSHVGAIKMRYEDFAGLVRPQIAEFHHEPTKLEC